MPSTIGPETDPSTGGGGGGSGTVTSVSNADGSIVVTGTPTVAPVVSVNPGRTLTPTAVKTANYTAVPGDFVPCDTNAVGAFTVLLPNAPPDKTLVGLKYITVGAGLLLTYQCQGTDTLNSVGGATSGVLTIKSQSEVMQYQASTKIWYLLAGDNPLGQLDLRFAPINNPIFTGDPRAPTPVFSDNDTSIATTAFVHAYGLTPTATKTGAYPAVAGDFVMADATSAPFTITAPALVAGVQWGVRLTTTTGNAVTLFTGSGTFDTNGTNTLVLASGPGTALVDVAFAANAAGTQWVSISAGKPNAYIASLYQTLFAGSAEISATKGGSLVGNGYNVNGTRVGADDMVIGDSIGRGQGGTFGVTDWGTDFANLENTLQGLPPAGVGLLLCKDTNDTNSSWSNTASGSSPASVILQGPAVTNTALQIAPGATIGDTAHTFRRVKIVYQTTYNGDAATLSVTGGSAPSQTVDTNSAGTGATASGFVITVPTANLVGSPPAIGDALIYQSGGAWTWATAPTIQSITTSGANTLITLTVTLGGGTGGTASVVSFSGYRMWDSGDLKAVVGTAITALGATHVTGAGGGLADIIGAKYYQTDGTKGLTMHNVAIGGQAVFTYGGSGLPIVPGGLGIAAWGWTEWLVMHANAGTPIRRLYVIGGINDPNVGVTVTQYNTALQAIVTAANLVSPSTEVVIVAEYYGAVVNTYANVVITNGSPVTYSTTGTLFFNGTFAFPAATLTFGGNGIPNATTVTTAATAPSVITANAGSITGTTYTGTGMTTGGIYAITGPGITGLIVATASSPTSAALTVPTGGGSIANNSGSYNLYPAITMSANVSNGGGQTTITAQSTLASTGPTTWANTWVPSAAQAAQVKGATFVNLYERFGDISVRGLAVLTAATTNSSVLTCSAGFPNAAANMAVNATGIQPGVFVLSTTATTMTVSAEVNVSNGVTVFYGQDIYGQCNATTPNLHMADSVNSWSGSDGQNAMAGWIFGRLGSIFKPEIATGSDSSLIALQPFTPVFVNGTPNQLSTTSEVMLYIQCTTSTGLTVNMGPTSAGTGLQPYPNATPSIGALATVRVPKGYYVTITATVANYKFRAIPC